MHTASRYSESLLVNSNFGAGHGPAPASATWTAPAPATISPVSLLELQLRRRDRRNKRFILNPALNQDDVSNKDSNPTPSQPSYQRPDHAATKPQETPQSIKPKETKTEQEVVKELQCWIQQYASLNAPDYDGRCIMTSLVSKTAPTIEPYPDLGKLEFTFKGGKDKEKRYHGRGSMEFSNGCYITGEWKNGVRDGHFRMDCDGDITFLEGTYTDGKINGRVRLHYKTGGHLIGLAKESVLHGFCRYYDSKQSLVFLGMYRNGVPFGTCWKFLEGGGTLVGRVDPEGCWTGCNIAYIYHDFSTGLFGQFQDGNIVQAQEVRLIGLESEYGCVRVPVFSQPSGQFYRREVSTTKWMTANTHLVDPYEAKTLYVAQSLTPEAEDGLFAARDLHVGCVAAFYNGLRRIKPENASSTWQLKDNAYKIFDPTNKKGVIDIPEEYRDISKYCASLAHKTNHSFDPNCEFSDFIHPRWGTVPCLLTIREVKKGEELTVTYGYDMDWCPDWYTDAWEKEFARRNCEDGESDPLKCG